MTGNPSFDQKKQSVDSQVNIGSQKNYYGASTLPLVPHQIPQPPADFTGREEDIAEILANFGQGATITGLRGLGGVGKTALALVLAEKLESRFPDGQIYLKLNGLSENPLSSEDALSKVIRAFRGLGERLPEDKDDLQVLYNSVLTGKLVLILLDNAGDGKQVVPLIPPKGCALLITSRKKFTLPGMPEPFLLYKLKPSDARDLLLKICPRIGNPAGEISKLCGHLPLALRAAASLLAVKSDLNPSSYLEELRSERMRLEKIGKEGVDLDVEASFNLSYNCLPEEMANVFRLLSVFPSDFDAQAEEFVCQDESHLNLSELATLSLVELQEAERYRLHDLARVFAASRMDAAACEPARLRHARHYEKLLWAANELFLQGNDSLAMGLKLFDINLINIESGQKWATENKTKSKEIAKICSDFAGAGSILNLRLHPLRNIEWLEVALVADRKIKNQNAEVSDLVNLGSAYLNIGELRKAIECYEQALKISREIMELKNEGNCQDGLGLAYAALGETRKAIEYLEQAIDIHRKISDLRSEGRSLGNLGVLLYQLDNKAEAIKLAKEALIIFEQIESPNAKAMKEMIRKWEE
jgi:tetratricopeptide (TPR) repeat protein